MFCSRLGVENLGGRALVCSYLEEPLVGLLVLGTVTVLVLALASLLLLLCRQMTFALSVSVECCLLKEQQLAEVSRNADDVWLQGSRKITSASDGKRMIFNYRTRVWFYVGHAP